MRDYSMVVSPELIGGSLTTPVIDMQLGTISTPVVEPAPIRGEEPIYSSPVPSQPIDVSFPVFSGGGGVKDQLPVIITPIEETPTQSNLPTLGEIDDNPPVKGGGASAVTPADVDAQIGGVIPPKTETPSTSVMPIFGGAGGGAGAGEEIKKQLGKNWFWVAVAVGAGIYFISRK